MGTFNLNKIFDINGNLKTSSQFSLIKVMDRNGNLKSSPQFQSNKVPDRNGNLGSLPATGPWEIQIGSTETVGQDMGSITNNYLIQASPVATTFASEGCTGYIDGVISGSGTLTVQNGPQTIGGVTYAGNGLQIFRGNNTHTGPLVLQANTNAQLGGDCSNATTKAGGNVTINAGATLKQYTAWNANIYLSQALTNDGTYTVEGCGTCGNGGIGLATTVANNGVINIDKAAWRNQSTWSGTGTINVKPGGTFQTTTNAIGNTTTINLNGCGWCNAAGMQVGAINAVGVGATIGFKINVQSASCITGGPGQNTNFTGLLSGTAPLTVNSLNTTKPNGIFHFSNTTNTYSGVMSVDGTSLNASYGNSLQYAKMNLINGGYMSSSASQTIGSLSGDSLATWRSADFMNHYIKANGITTYAGKLLWNGGSNTANFWLEGGSQNQLTMTGTGNTGNMYVRNGAKLILQGATWTGTNGQIRVQTGGTVSAGTSTTGAAVLIYLDATSSLDVFASGAGTGIINTGPGTSLLSNGWKVNIKDAMAPGSYVIWKNTGAAITQLPTTGINNSGRTATYAWNNAVSPKTLTMTLT